MPNTGYCTSPRRCHVLIFFQKLFFVSQFPNYLCLFIRFPNLVYTPINKKSAFLIKPIANKMFYKPAIVECMDCWKSPSTAEISLLSFPLHLHTHTHKKSALLNKPIANTIRTRQLRRKR